MDAGKASIPEDYGPQWPSGTRGQPSFPVLSASSTRNQSYRTGQDVWVPQTCKYITYLVTSSS